MFHHLAYDLNNFLVDLLKMAEDPDDIDIIPQNLEKFKAVYTDHFIFMDTLQFLPASLAELVDNLKSQGTDNFKRLRAHYPNNYEFSFDSVFKINNQPMNLVSRQGTVSIADIFQE